jgi:hypothetical protein
VGSSEWKGFNLMFGESITTVCDHGFDTYQSGDSITSECPSCESKRLQDQNAQFAGQFHVEQISKQFGDDDWIAKPDPNLTAEPAVAALIESQPQVKETVNHPAHYNAGSIEVIDAIEAWQLGFCDGNVVKYVARFRHKNGVEDLKKARWYLDRLIQQEEKACQNSK